MYQEQIRQLYVTASMKEAPVIKRCSRDVLFVPRGPDAGDFCQIPDTPTAH